MRTLRAFLFVALVSISFLKAQGVTYNQEFKVNTYNDKIDGYPAVTSLSNGGYVVCWVSRYYEDGSNWGSFISGQVYDSSSMAVNQEFKMNKLNKTTGDPPIIKKTDAGFAIFGDGYQYQEFNNNGQKIGKEIFLRKSGAGIQWDSDFDVLTNGNIVLCYTDHDDDFDTYFVIFNDENTRLTANTKVNTYTDGEQGYSYVCSLKDSNFVVFWHSNL